MIKNCNFRFKIPVRCHRLFFDPRGATPKKFVLASLSNEDILNRLQEISNQQTKLRQDMDIKQEISEPVYKDEELERVINDNLEKEKINLQDQTEEISVSLSLSEISLKNYCQPGIYAIESKVNNTVYVGETDHLIRRLGRHYSDLGCSHQTPVLLQKAWNELKSNNFTFMILESGGDHLKSKSNRVYYQNRYIVEYVGQGKDIYNIIISDKTINEVINVIKNVEKLKQNQLHPINENVDFLFQASKIWQTPNLGRVGVFPNRKNTKAEYKRFKPFVFAEKKMIVSKLSKRTKIQAFSFQALPVVSHLPARWGSTQPGVYSFKNMNNDMRYIGESNYVMVRLFKNTVSLNARSFYDQPKFQDDWTSNKEESFEISLLEYGSKFDSRGATPKKIRRAYETQYIQYYSPNVYNMPVNVKELIERGERKSSDWNRVPIYRKIDNDYRLYDSISKAIKDAVITETMLRKHLDNPENSDWFYGRTYGRYFNSGRIKFIVINLNKVYLNLYLASYYEKISYTTLKRWLTKKDDNFDYTYFDELNKEQKESIPNLKKQISKALRLTIPLPFDPNNLIEKEILQEQSPIYSKSSQEVSLSDTPKEFKKKMKERLKKLIKQYYIV